MGEETALKDVAEVCFYCCRVVAIPFDGIEELNFAYAKPSKDTDLAQLAQKIKGKIRL